MLLLSARTPSALEQTRVRLAGFLEATPEVDLSDVAFTLAEGRTRLPVRDAIVASSVPAAAVALRERRSAPVKALATPRVIFVFPGQGVQRVGMCRDLYKHEPVFRSELDACDRILSPLLGESLLGALYPEGAEPDKASNEFDSGLSRLDRTWLAQPAIFAVCYALARLWEFWGIVPAMVVGHSIGEFVAAAIAGSLSLDKALALIAARGRLMQQQPSGAMLAVRASEERVRGLLPAALDLAAINAPQSVTVSGSDHDIAAFAEVLTAQGIAVKRLATSHGFHSRSMDAVPAALREALPGLKPASPRLPWISSYTGSTVTAENLPTWDWARQARESVRFADAIRAAHTTLIGDAIFLEVAPSATLQHAMRETLAGKLQVERVLTGIASTNGATEEPEKHALLAALARLTALGVEPRWEKLRSDRTPKRVLLPTYPFERKRYWVDAPRPVSATSLQAAPPLDPVDPHNASPISAGSQRTSMASDSPISDNHTLSSDNAVLNELKAIVTELSDLDLSSVAATTSFVELGLDSLFLTQLTQAIRSRYGVKLTFRQIMGELGTFAALADHLRPHIKAVVQVPASEPATLSTHAVPAVPAAPDEGYAALFAQQLQALTDLMQRQLAVLGTTHAAAMTVPATLPKATATAAVNLAKPLPSVAHHNAAVETTLGTMVPFRPLELRQETPLTAKQQGHVTGLVSRSNTRTGASKQHVAQYRDLLADPRVASGFHPEWKEMVYPLVVERAHGAHLWDKDGNRYIDILNGYGSILFGHSPQFVTDALRAQLELGFPIGPQTELAGECAALIAEHDRYGAGLLLQYRVRGGDGCDASRPHGHRPRPDRTFLRRVSRDDRRGAGKVDAFRALHSRGSWHSARERAQHAGARVWLCRGARDDSSSQR